MPALRVFVLGLSVALVAGCAAAGPPVATTIPVRTAASAPVPLCGTADLDVTWTHDGVRAENVSGHACALEATFAVWVLWWQVQAPGPSAAVGVLAPGAALVQAYRAVASNTCPAPPRAAGEKAPLAVQVDGHSYTVQLEASQVYTITTCTQVAALPPRIDRAG